jgi:hypothetical protein
MPAAMSAYTAPQNPHKSGSLLAFPHKKPTNETTLSGTRRHGCYHGPVSLLTSLYAGEADRPCSPLQAPEEETGLLLTGRL